MSTYDSKAEFFKMISANIRKDLDPNDFELGDPEPLPFGLNTQIRIRPYHASHWYTNRVMRYNRGDLGGQYMVTVYRHDALSLIDLLDQINEEPLFHLNQRLHPQKDLVSIPGVITPGDIVDVELPSQDGRLEIKIPMLANPKSLFLVGALQVRILRDI